MKRKSYGRDAGLSLRMVFTSFLLGLLYVIFAIVLFQYLNIGLVPMLLIVIGLAFFQYYTSDKLALKAAGAKIVDRDEAPELHDLVERLCAMADLPKPKVAIVDTDVPNAFATGRSPKHAAVAVTSGLWRRLDKEEIESVLAHELSHHFARHDEKQHSRDEAEMIAESSAFIVLAHLGRDSGECPRFHDSRSALEDHSHSREAVRSERCRSGDDQ